ncbi:MAG: sulfite exporter TauE/SafE family protein [Flavobacteriales bacterium]|nr:sulfite exporter TauE/SafE family protein [Flavobacteriales bacterium]
MNEIWIPLILLVVAMLYASVGHGGASGYLAIMALFGFSAEVMRPTALLLNLFVSGIAFVQFQRAGHFKWRLFWPFALASMPFAWLGARIDLDPLIYERILAVCLLVAVARLLGLFGRGDRPVTLPPPSLALFIGAVLGLVSGMIGIGGGILLSPLLLVFGWSTAKESAGISAAFIFVNSASGLIGLGDLSPVLTGHHLLWIVAVVVGGTIGGRTGALRITEVRLKQVLSAVLMLASLKLFFA